MIIGNLRFFSLPVKLDMMLSRGRPNVIQGYSSEYPLFIANKLVHVVYPISIIQKIKKIMVYRPLISPSLTRSKNIASAPPLSLSQSDSSHDPHDEQLKLYLTELSGQTLHPPNSHLHS